MTGPRSTDNWHVLHVATQEVERAFPVETWTIDGVPIWPLVKADLSTETYRAWRGSDATPARAPRLTERFPIRPALDMWRARARYREAVRDDRASEAPLRRADALFYSDGVSFVKLDGKFYERICEPLIERVIASGRTAAMVTPLSEFHRPRHFPSTFIQPRLDRARLEARMRNVAGRALARRYPTHLPGWDAALAQLRRDVPSIRVGDRARYEALVTYLHAYERAFDRVLSIVRPAVVFIVCYYAIEPMALIRACRARGIVSVDVQHGSINDSHHAYAARHAFPAGGLDLLPDAFWVWDEVEAAVIRRWTNDLPAAPRTIVGGNVFLQTWRDESKPFVRAAAERVASIKARHPRLTHVVHTLQGIETAAQIERLIDAVQRSTDRFFWWFRLHPTQLRAIDSIRASFAPAGTDNFLVQAHTEIPLYGVLPHMAAHVTYSSSTVREATAFSVPSVLTSSDERVMYEHDLAKGWAVIADPGTDLVQSIAEQIARAPALRAREGEAQRASGADPLTELFSHPPR